MHAVKNLPTEEIIPALRKDELSENECLRSESNTHSQGWEKVANSKRTTDPSNKMFHRGKFQSYATAEESNEPPLLIPQVQQCSNLGQSCFHHLYTLPLLTLLEPFEPEETFEII